MLLVVSLAATGGCREAATGATVLRLATTQSGERMREPFRAALRAFEAAHPGVRVEHLESDDDVYQKMGLVTLFVGGSPPDIYFQWGGYQVRKWAAAGYALDLTGEFPSSERARYLPVCWPSATGWDGRIYLWPDTASLTTVFWYRRSVFERLGLRPPPTWPGFLALCGRLKQAGMNPLAVGNRELWGGGNFAAYLIAQHAGTETYNRVLDLEPGTCLDDPRFVAGLEIAADLVRRGFLNQGVSGVGTDEARALLLQRRAGMHPIGDWLVTDAGEADAGDLDAFLLPHLPGQAGVDRTLLALSTGYMIYRRTPHPDLARALLRHLTSDAVQRDWARHGHVSALRAAAPGPDAPPGQRRMSEFLRTAAATALAPDVGFNLEVSDAFLDAASLVLGGRAAAAAALSGAEQQVAALRRARK